MQDDHTITTIFYEVTIDGAYYDSWIGYETAVERIEELVKDSTIGRIELFEIERSQTWLGVWNER